MQHSQSSLAKQHLQGWKSGWKHFMWLMMVREGGGGGERGMAGRWSRGWEEYEPCGIGLTSHSLPSAAQDMWGWTFPTPLILFLWVRRPQHTITLLQTEERGPKKISKNKGRCARKVYTHRRRGGSGVVVRLRGIEEEGEHNKGRQASVQTPITVHENICTNSHTIRTGRLSALWWRRTCWSDNPQL